MIIKKAVQTTVIAATLFTCIPCFATIPKEEMTIGDIYIGQPAQEVFEKYGKPVSQEEMYDNKKLNYIIKNNYGLTNSFAVITKETNYKAITGVSLTANIGLKTKAGIGIGSTKEDVKQIYGTPDICTTPTGSSVSIEETQGALELKYKADNNEPYELKLTLAGPNQEVTAIGISTTQ